jgi:hypothetical protein
MRKHHREVIKWLKGVGATRVHIDPGHKHPRIGFDWAGRRHAYPMSGSPANAYFAVKRTICDLRQIIEGEPAQ